VAQDADRNLLPGTLPRNAPQGEAAPDREAIVTIETDSDIVTARQKGRAMAAELGFEPGDRALIATAISELARNIVTYARRGEIVLRESFDGSRRSLVVASRDAGPGISDVGQALRDGYSTSGGLGLGLPGVKRLMDEFHIESSPGRGTTVTARKWRR
jgi:serine/threonine-protein kinase RsbT